jgi:hypothetical protein
MSTKSKIAIAAGVVVSMAAIGGGVFAVNTLLDNKKTERFTFNQPIHKVIVKGDAGNVRVVASDSHAIQVQETRRWVSSEPKPKRSVAAGVLRLEEACSGWIALCETSYVIQVPRNLDVDIDVDAGDVTITGLSGAVSVKSDAGDVKGTGLAAARISADTDAGDVRLAFTTPPVSIDASTDAGDVEIDLPSTEYALDLDTGAGSTSISGIVRYDLAEHAVKARTSAGDVTIHGR